MEDYVYVLDYLPTGKPYDKKREAVVQGVGDKNFTLLEFVPKPGATINLDEKLYIGEELDKREKVDHIRGRIDYENLTRNSQIALESVLDILVTEQESRFVDFFNRAGPVTTKLHQIELLPGVGKKHMWDIIDQRDAKKFESFADLTERVKLLPDPKKSIVKKIVNELAGTEKYLFFTLPLRRFH